MKKETKIVGDLCNPSRGQIDENQETLIDYVDISSIDSARKKVIRYQTMSLREAPSRARKLAEKGDILVSTVRPNLNSVAILEQDTPNVTVVSTAFCVLNCKETTHNRFLFYYCRSKFFIEDMVSQATGASYPAVSEKIVRMAKVPSYGYDEQKRISTVLDSISRIIDMRKDELEELDNLIKARFVEMFGDPEENPFNLDKVPLSEVIMNANNGMARRGNDEDGNVVLRLVELQDGYIDYSSPNRIILEDTEKKRYLLKDKDFLFARVNGNPDNVGRCAVFRDIGEDVYHNDHIIRVHFKEELLDGAFASVLLNSDYGKRQLKNQIKTSAGQYTVSQDGLGSIVIILPSLGQQNQFADFVTQVDKSKVVG